MEDRWALVSALANHADDAEDRNLPLMIWYAAEQAMTTDRPVQAMAFLKAAKIPKLQQFTARRLTAMALDSKAASITELKLLAGYLAETDSPTRRSMVTGMLAALKGRQSLPSPANWETAYAKLSTDTDPGVRDDARKLALIFGGKSALTEVRAVLTDAKAPVEKRRAALEALAVQRDAATLDPLLKLVAETGPLRVSALKALAVFDDPRIAPAVLGAYTTLAVEEKVEALNTLASRPQNTRALFAAIDAKQVPVKDVTAQLARVIQGFKDKDLDAWLEKNWGALKTSNADKQKEIERHKRFLGTDAILRADVKNGRAIFERTCAACHTMFGKGGKIGPELPGNFADIDYLLQNILDPNAAIGKDYQQTFVTTKSGLLHAGVIIAEDANSVTLKTLADSTVIPRAEIKSQELSPNSMMPEGIISGLQEPEIRDLFLYLRQPSEP